MSTDIAVFIQVVNAVFWDSKIFLVSSCYKFNKNNWTTAMKTKENPALPWATVKRFLTQLFQKLEMYSKTEFLIISLLNK